MESTADVTERETKSPRVAVAPVAETRRDDDQLLVERARAGDETAFEALYRRHASAVFGLTLRMLRNRADAEDMLQEIFTHAYHRLSSFEGRSAFGTWLYRLGTNRCLDHLRSRSAREQSRTDALVPELVGGRPPNGTRAMELERAIGELPPSSRAAFLLHDVAGYDHKEVGDILGVAVGTSKSLVHRARMKLRQSLKPASAGDPS